MEIDSLLLDTIESMGERVAHHFHLPLQSGADSVLRRMKRPYSAADYLGIVTRLAQRFPESALGADVIVGFPGETDADFRELLDFVEETQFERLGVFKYSEEEGTAAAKLGNSLSAGEIEGRWQELMELQADISRNKNQALIGSIQRVMMCGLDAETQKLHGRTQAHAPEVDGAVFITGAGGKGQTTPDPGAFAEVRITEASEYDLVGELSDA